MNNGDGVLANKKDATGHFKIAANKGVVESMFNFSVMLDDSDGIQNVS